MKLTEAILKKIILEVLGEHMLPPDPKNIPEEFLQHIHDLIDAGHGDQAQALIDTFDGDPNYVHTYINYPKVGDIEKLGNKQRALVQKHGGIAGMHSPDFPWDDHDAIDSEIERLAKEKSSDPDEITMHKRRK